MKAYWVLLLVMLLNACSKQPQPINYGNEECSACKMTIMDKKFGAELISTKGKIYKFDDLVCMVELINNSSIKTDEIDKRLVIDYQKENNFIDATRASYYVGEDVHSPMNGNAAAFLTKQDAQKFQNGKRGNILEWNEVYDKLK